MRVALVNVGMPREVEWDGRTVVTGIFKSPVAAKLPVRRLNIDGAGQAELGIPASAKLDIAARARRPMLGQLFELTSVEAG